MAQNERLFCGTKKVVAKRDTPHTLQNIFLFLQEANVREDYLRQAQKVITDPNILINVVSKRVKQLKFGGKPTVESLEKLSLEDVALLEVIKGNITYELAANTPEGEAEQE